MTRAMAEAGQHGEKWSPEVQLRVRAALRDIRYGTVSLVVQDGKVIQIDRSEKVRIR